MIFFLLKIQIFIQIYFLVIIVVNFIYKQSKCKEKILKMAEFTNYLNYISLVFFNALKC